MNYCPHCRNPLAEDAQFCAFCGKQVPQSTAPPSKPAFCYKCGKPLESGAQFCTACGADLNVIPANRPAWRDTAPIPQNQTVRRPGAPVPELPLCPRCGAVWGGIALFCNKCGASREEMAAGKTSRTKKPTPAAHEAETPPETPKSQVKPQPQKKKTGMIAGIVAAVLVLTIGLGLILGIGTTSTPVDGTTEPRPGVVTLESLPADNSTQPIPAEEAEEIHLSLSLTEGDQSWIEERLDVFHAEHPEYILTLDITYVNPQDAAFIANDPAAAPDVFMYAPDMFPILQEAGVLAPVEGEYLEELRRTTGKSLMDFVTGPDGKVYGFPYSPNTWFMYYDKSVYTQEDVRSLETMLAKGGVFFPVNNSWYIGAFYVAGGATFFGPHGNDSDAGIQLHNGNNVTMYLADLVNNRNFYGDQNNADPQDLIGSGKVSAYISGSWHQGQMYELWGNNMGVAAPPTINLDGEICQLQAFASAYGIGVNAYSKNQEAAYIFAAFLASQESQLARYVHNGIYPTHLNLLNDSTISADPVAMASIATTATASIAQPTIPEMASYWFPMNQLGELIISGEVDIYTATPILTEIQIAINNG